VSTRKSWKTFNRFKGLLIWIIILVSWEGAYRIVGWRSWIFPAPSHVIDATAAMLNIPLALGDSLHKGWPKLKEEGDARPASALGKRVMTSPLVIANLVSATRLSGGFVISIALGGVLGLLMWRWNELNRFLGALFLGLQTLPSVCWVPLGILVFGINELSILFVLVMGSCFAMAISLRDGLKMIPPLYERAGLMLGARGWKLYRYVLIPASLPAFTASLRQGFSFAWRSLLGAELILSAEQHGLGFLLDTGRQKGIDSVLAVMVMMILIGILADRLVFGKLQAAVHRRFGLA
jgi:NitT/TauT family transport system permease protein